MKKTSKRLNTALIEAAKKAASKAYAPYSKFQVGAALLGANGKIYTGANLENVSYGLTVCAERNAIAAMVHDGVSEWTQLVVFTSTPKPTAPCGTCRQVLYEFSPEGLGQVWLACSNAKTQKKLSQPNTLISKPFSLKTLLPHAFVSFIIDQA